MQNTSLFPVTRIHGLPMLHLQGDIDCYRSPLVLEEIFRLIAKGESDVILNLNAVDYVDSYGLGALVAVHNRCIGQGGSMRVLCANRSIWRVFDITGLQRLFPVYKEDVALMASLDAK